MRLDQIQFILNNIYNIYIYMYIIPSIISLIFLRELSFDLRTIGLIIVEFPLLV